MSGTNQNTHQESNTQSTMGPPSTTQASTPLPPHSPLYFDPVNGIIVYSNFDRTETDNTTVAYPIPPPTIIDLTTMETDDDRIASVTTPNETALTIPIIIPDAAASRDRRKTLI